MLCNGGFGCVGAWSKVGGWGEQGGKGRVQGCRKERAGSLQFAQPAGAVKRTEHHGQPQRTRAGPAMHVPQSSLPHAYAESLVALRVCMIWKGAMRLPASISRVSESSSPSEWRAESRPVEAIISPGLV